MWMVPEQQLMMASRERAAPDYEATVIDWGQWATNILVSTLMGPAALAFYSAGSYQRPIVSVLRGALADAIFPDMVVRGPVMI